MLQAPTTHGEGRVAITEAVVPEGLAQEQNEDLVKELELFVCGDCLSGSKLRLLGRPAAVVSVVAHGEDHEATGQRGRGSQRLG